MHRLWALLNLSVGMWGLGAFLISQSDTAAIALIRWRITEIGVVFIAVLFTHSTFIVCNIHRKKVVYFAYLQGFIFSIASLFSMNFFKDVKFVFNSIYYAEPGPIFSIFFVVWMMLVTYAQLLLFITYRKSSGAKRNQIRYFLFACFVGLLGGSTNFLPHFFDNRFYPFGNFTIVLYCIIITYAILKYRVLDLNIFVTRTGIFAAVYSVVLGIPFALAFGCQDQLKNAIGEKWWIIPLVSSTVLATAGPYIYLYIQKRAENRLMQEQRRYQSTLRQASSGMSRIKDLKKLLNLIVRIVNRTVNLTHTSIYLYNKKDNAFTLEAFRDHGQEKTNGLIKAQTPLIKHIIRHQEPIVYEEIKQRAQDYNDQVLFQIEQQLAQLDAALVVPSIVEDKVLGIILLGKKRSEKLFSGDDIAVFSILANQLGIAVENTTYIAQAQIRQKELYQTEKLAYVGRLASSVAHEIKNPLTSIKTFIDYLPRKYGEHQFRRNFEKIVPAEICRIEKIVYQLMDLARERSIDLRPVNIRELIDSTLFLVSNQLSIKRIKIRKDFPADDKIVSADENQIRQVFLNLFLNAFAAMDNNGTLSVKMKAGTIEGRPAVVVRVADDGCGISSEGLKQLFKPFHTTKKDGIGLGLVISKEIVEQHKGTIEVESRPGKGTVFTITLRG